MKKRVVGLFLVITVIISTCTPAFAINKTAELFEYYDTCSFEDGSILEASILDNGNLLISLSKDNILLESTEIDYARKVLLFTDVSNDDKTHYVKEIPFSSYMEYNSPEDENLSTFSKGTYKQFGKVSFRGQIATDYYSTPKADVYVCHNTPGDERIQTVHVSDVHSVTTLVSIIVSALAIIRPEITAIKSFLIALGLITVDGVLSNTVDNIDLKAIKIWREYQSRL